MPDSRFFFNEINFENFKIRLNEDSVLCFVGANGTGKTAALEKLHSLTQAQPNKTKESGVVNAEISRELDDSLIDEIIEKLDVDDLDRFIVPLNLKQHTALQRTDDRKANRSQFRRTKYLDALLSYYVDAKARLNLVEPLKLNQGGRHSKNHPFFFLHDHPEREKTVSRFVKQLFGYDLHFQRHKPGVLSIHLVQNEAMPDTQNITSEVIRKLKQLPEITTEGAGIQAAAGIICAIFSTHHKVIFVDEPDVFLHPPQAVALGEIMSMVEGRQLFIATHSAKLLQGLAKGNPNRVKIIRLKKNSSGYTATDIATDVFNTVSSDPLLRFTNILESLFYDKTIICEGEKDCLVFSEALRKLNLVPSQAGLHFVSAHGASGLKKLFEICVKLRSDTIVICDFDLLFPKDRHNLLALSKLAGGDACQHSKDLAELDKMIDSANLLWQQAESGGLNSFSSNSDVYNLCEKILSSFFDLGILIVPYGELEDISKPKAQKGNAEALLANIEHAKELQRARDFSEKLAKRIKMI